MSDQAKDRAGDAATYKARIIHTLELDGSVTYQVFGDTESVVELKQRTEVPPEWYGLRRDALSTCGRCGGFRGHGHVCDL